MLTRLGATRPVPPAQPTEFIAFCIVERPQAATSWVRCGQARLNRDGSINVRLDALPLSGELHLRPAETSVQDDGRTEARRTPVVAPAPADTPPLHS